MGWSVRRRCGLVSWMTISCFASLSFVVTNGFKMVELTAGPEARPVVRLNGGAFEYD